ncbi:hypothetical protein N7449_003847 [Penicillium cf. viridicatum]|uniref:Uncharacterized protein n=1 Tax=Penicillium cf. viridicatum TaxID=2972119 RepID=A0A9W9MYA7_9EURO|nr:hypothetical protein N7449_003847 [Penicillium cf. viridicatum]
MSHVQGLDSQPFESLELFRSAHYVDIWRSRKTLRIHGLNMGSLAYGRTRYSSDGILKLPI